MSSLIPNYTIQGHQHASRPYVDKAESLETPLPPSWTQQPSHKTRSELVEHRRQLNLPDRTYDVDGDGSVSHKDYFLSRQFDANKDHNLDASEKAALSQALKEGFADRFYWGLDKSGAKRSHPTFQLKGHVYTYDTAFTLGKIHGISAPSQQQQQPHTRSQLLENRRGELKNAATVLAGEAERKSFVRVLERPVENNLGYVAQPEYTSIQQINERKHQQKRQDAGLNPGELPVSVKQADDFARLEIPTCTALRAQRREDQVRSLEEKRIQGERTFIPSEVKNSIRDKYAFDFRDANDSKSRITLSELKFKRRNEYIEHNMKHFPHKTPKLPEFAANPDLPWWEHHRPAGSASKSDAKEPLTPPPRMDFKVTQTPWPVAKVQREAPVIEVAPIVEMPADYKVTGSRKRWTTDMIERGALRNTKRYFDTLQSHQSLAQDYWPMEAFSSFDLIKMEAQRKIKETKSRNSQVATISVSHAPEQLTIRRPKKVAAASQEASSDVFLGPLISGVPAPDLVRTSGFVN